MNGAAAPGAADGFYGALCAALQAAGFRVVVDATGAQLAAALRRGPELVKVNRREALAALEERPDGEDAADDSDADPWRCVNGSSRPARATPWSPSARQAPRPSWAAAPGVCRRRPWTR